MLQDNAMNLILIQCGQSLVHDGNQTGVLTARAYKGEIFVGDSIGGPERKVFKLRLLEQMP